LVHTDHYSLKFLLDQRLCTVPQHQWISKLFGFDFSVYRPGHLNIVADALSCQDTEAGALTNQEGMDAADLALSGPSFTLLDDIRRAQEAMAEG